MTKDKVIANARTIFTDTLNEWGGVQNITPENRKKLRRTVIHRVQQKLPESSVASVASAYNTARKEFVADGTIPADFPGRAKVKE